MSRKPSTPKRSRGQAAVPDQPVLLDIDPAVAGGFILGRFDVMLYGRVVSADPITDIAVLTDGRQVAALRYGDSSALRYGESGQARPSDGGAASQRAFQFTVSRRRERAAGDLHCRIVARTAGGVHDVPYVMAIDPAGQPSVKVRSGPVQPAAGYTAMPTPAILYVERAFLDGDGNLQVYGWAVAQAPIISVQAFVGGKQVASAGVIGERADVGQAYSAYPDARRSGFALNTRLVGADRTVPTIRLQLLCQRGIALETELPLEQILERRLRPVIAAVPAAGVLEADAAADAEPGAQAAVAGAPVPSRVPVVADIPTRMIRPIRQNRPAPPPDRTPAPARVATPRALPPPISHPAAPHSPPPRPLSVSDPRREITSFCDKATLSEDGTLIVAGWAVSAVGITRILVFLDGKRVGEAEYGAERLDVGGKFPAIPEAARSGFRCQAQVAGTPKGHHTIHVMVYNSLGDENTVTAPVGAEEPNPAEARASDRPEFRFQIDAPMVSDGHMVEPVTGRLTIEGWVLARSGVAGIQVYLDDRPMGQAHYGLARQDVGVAFPDWINALRSGYAFHCPPRSLRDGVHTVRIAVTAANGQEHNHSFTINVRKIEEKDDLANIRRRVSRAEWRCYADQLASLDFQPRFHIVVRQDGVLDQGQLRATLAGLAGQAYPAWTARVLCDRADQTEPVRAAIAASDPDPAFAARFTVIGPADAAAWDGPLAEAGVPTLCGVLSAGDELGGDALMKLALAAALRRDADFLYADEARISPASNEREAFFKPDHSPDLLLSTNYIGRPWVASAALLGATGVTPRGLAVDGEYDLILRCIERAAAVHHLPVLLCRRGAAAIDPAPVEQAALERAAMRGRHAAHVLPAAVPGTWRLQRSVASAGKVSIIIPTCAARGYIETCLKTLRSRTAYHDFEIIVIDNIPDRMAKWKPWVRKHADKVVDMPDAFNWSRFNNRAAEVADGEYLLFLNDDIEIVQPEWLDAMLEHAQRPEVGIVGPQLLYPDRKVQHAGMFLGANGLGRHAFRFNGEDEPGYFGLALTQRNVIAVTGACMLLRRDTFNRLGRFDEAHQIINNDLDFCLRAHRARLVTVFTPYAKLIHHELASRDRLKDVFDLSHFNAQWKTLYASGDPYFSPCLSKHADDVRPDDEAVQAVFAGHPLFDSADIRRILVVKLDHIGDFVTALPAIRRLKQTFPGASITVLGAPASRAFVALEPAIDTFLEFNFFHARSQLGERTVTQDEYEALRVRLAPYRFDLAVDLRKHLSTRDVLRYSGARFLAGFDFQGQFPFLDVALEWDNDKALQRKRGHVADDLLALVAAVGNACRAEELLIQPSPPPASVDTLPAAVRPLFGRAVVAVHPGAGNATKQWPAEHFSAVVDLLIEREDVSVVLVGGPDEAEHAAALLTTVLHRDRVVSVVGETSLVELSGLLSACALYIGNDSGPKHIAAALGVPTLGIHSGVVDAVEWAPVGLRAVALRRNMACSPCYLAQAEDCPRNLACLRFLEPSFVYQAARMLLTGRGGSTAEVAPGPPPAVNGRRKSQRRPQSERISA